MREEIWMPIKGFEQSYCVSTLGRVKSLPRKRKNKHGESNLKGKIRRLQTHSAGYLIIGLNNHKKYTFHRVHRLVADAFLDNTEKKRTVNHLDGNKQNNCLSNLEWATDKENVNHHFRSGRANPAKGERNGRSKLDERQVIEILDLKGKHSTYVVGSMFGVHPVTILRIWKGELWSYLN